MEILELFRMAFVAVSSWFTTTMNVSGMGGVYLASIFLTVLFARLITPIFGQAGSDRARGSKKSQKNSGVSE